MSRLSISSQAGGGASEFNRSVSVPAIQLARNFSGSRYKDGGGKFAFLNDTQLSFNKEAEDLQ